MSLEIKKIKHIIRRSCILSISFKNINATNRRKPYKHKLQLNKYTVDTRKLYEPCKCSFRTRPFVSAGNWISLCPVLNRAGMASDWKLSVGALPSVYARHQQGPRATGAIMGLERKGKSEMPRGCPANRLQRKHV